MGIIRSIKPALCVAGLMFVAAGAAAQTAGGADKLCPLQNGPLVTEKLLPSKSRILTVKNPGAKNCPGGQCQMEVEVQSYTNSAGAPACCVRAEYGSFVVKKTRKDVVLRWNLGAKDSNRYVFNPGDGVRIISPLPDPGDFGPPSIHPQGQWYKIPSLNGRAKDFNYGFTIFRKDTDGGFLKCDPIDPVIVNQGN
jgi:hypothetical protein